VQAEAIARIAREVLARQGQKAPPVDIDYVAAGEGLVFVPADIERISGGYFCDLDGHGHAIISSREHPLRQRFTKAHELGHHILDEAVRPASLVQASAYRKANSPRHWAQDYFAGSLLLPRRWVADLIRDTQGWGTPDELIREVAKRFEVSRPAAEVRLRELHHIPSTR